VYGFSKIIMEKWDDNKAACRKWSSQALLCLWVALLSLFFTFICMIATSIAAERVYVIPAQPPVRSQPYVQPQPVPPRQYQYRYVAPKNWYGQRRAVPNAYEAGRIMGQYYQGREVRIGPVVERDIFYQADVRDSRGVLIDKVIIDKRTGRMRSTY
jgi:hypothetical protein